MFAKKAKNSKRSSPIPTVESTKDPTRNTASSNNLAEGTEGTEGTEGAEGAEGTVLKRPNSSPTLSHREKPEVRPERSHSATNMRRNNKGSVANKKDCQFVDLLFEVVDEGSVKLPKSLRPLQNSDDELANRLRTVSTSGQTPQQSTNQTNQTRRGPSPSIGDRLLFGKLRELVSKKKRRYKVDSFNLDLSYITDRIIAMGFPSEEREGLYRNPMEQVVLFLESRHANHYRVYNLCSEPNRKYDASKFLTGSVIEIGFEDHNAPPFALIDEFCSDAENWLNRSQDNIIAAHCKAGKGRTGTLICCLFLKLKEFDNATDALAFYGLMRTTNNKGVTIPSQIRYVHYYDNRNKKDTTNPPTLRVDSISLSHVPKITPSELYFTIKTDGKEFDSRNAIPVQSLQVLKPYKYEIPAESNFLIKSDAKFIFSYGKNSDTIFQFWIHTSFIENNQLTLSKSEIDKIHKDKKHQIVPQEFTLEIRFSSVVV